MQIYKPLVQEILKCVCTLYYGGGLVTKSCPTIATPWTVAHQAPLSIGFSRQEYWSGLPFLSPGNLPDPGIEPASPALQAGSLLTELLEKPWLGGGEIYCGEGLWEGEAGQNVGLMADPWGCRQGCQVL